LRPCLSHTRGPLPLAPQTSKLLLLDPSLHLAPLTFTLILLATLPLALRLFDAFYSACFGQYSGPLSALSTWRCAAAELYPLVEMIPSYDLLKQCPVKTIHLRVTKIELIYPWWLPSSLTAAYEALVASPWGIIAPGSMTEAEKRDSTTIISMRAL
jgi:hypothetical protein